MDHISKKSITLSIILLFIGVSFSSGISIDTETIEVEDCGCNNSNYIVDYPPVVCGVLCAMIRVIGPIGDVIGILLIGLGYTKDEVENMLSPVINFYNSLLDMWSELNCPSCYSKTI